MLGATLAAAAVAAAQQPPSRNEAVGRVNATSIMPSFPLANSAEGGLEFPALGFGSGAYGSDPACAVRPGCMGIGNGCGACAYESMLAWLQLGGRRLDLAYSYDNDAEVARAIRDSGVPRSELFILSKVHLGREDALVQMEKILRDLQTDHVDALLIHWPTRGGSGLDPLCYGDFVDPTACRISTWRALLDIFQRGQARSIGVSNFYPEELQEIIDAGLPLPSINQCPFHLYRSSSQDEAREFCGRHQIHFNGYSPYGVPDLYTFPPGPGPPMAPSTLEDPRPAAVASRLGGGVTPAQVLLAWQLRVGVSLNPRSTSAQHMADGLEALALAPALTDEELVTLGSAPQVWCSLMPSNYQCAPDRIQNVGSSSAAAAAAIATKTRGHWKPSPKCQGQVDKYCSKCYGALKARPCDGPMVARHSSNLQHDPDSWRCYSPSTLIPDHQSYSHGSCYCTEDRPIRAILKACGDQDPEPPPPPPPPPLRPGEAPCPGCV
jgi:diketogulonate reductase-like aldo/keto reductase